MNELDKAWAAGMLSVSGTITTRRASNGTLAALLVVKSSRTQEAIRRLCAIIDVLPGNSMVNGKHALMFTLTGKKLHKVMTELWPQLPKERQREYARARRLVQAEKSAQQLASMERDGDVKEELGAAA